MNYNILRKLGKTEGKWAKRLYEELAYISEISCVKEGRFDALLDGALKDIERVIDGKIITKNFVFGIEERLKDLSPYAKEIEVLCMGHAHLDMNWMWGYQETVDEVLCTLQTALMFLEEYSDFKFSLSQASVYAIVAKYRPDLLEEEQTESSGTRGASGGISQTESRTHESYRRSEKAVPIRTAPPGRRSNSEPS